MKIKFIFCLLFFSYISVFSQEHLKFKEIPINGTISEYSKKLVKIGYVITKRNLNSIVLSGKFIGINNCEIRVVGANKSKIIWKVVVYLPEQTNWYSIKQQYSDLKLQFQAKYGDGESYEFFSSPYEEGDGYEMQALKLEKCTHLTAWGLECGSITLRISKFEQISISYEDKINSTQDDKEKEIIINNDI